MPKPPTSLLLLHGFASSFEHGWRQSGWVDILSDFGCDAPPIDLPAHGTSPRSADPETYRDVPETLFRSLPGEPPYNAVGFSMGAQTLLRMAIAHPTSFSRLALLGIGDSIFDPAGSADEMIGALTADTEPDDVQARLFRRLAATTGSDVASLVAFLSRSSPPISVEMLSAVRCPVLVVLGERDEATPTLLLEGLPDARLVTLPGVDHFATPQDFGAIDATLRFFGFD